MYKTTKLEMDLEQQHHANETKYKIFRVKDKKQEVIEYFWAADSDIAYKKLLEMRLSNNDENIFFEEVYKYIHENDDGTISVCDSFREQFSFGDDEDKDDEEESPYQIARKEKQIMLKDFKYFLDHYDVDSNSSHMRCESWSLDLHILGDIEFNIDRIKKESLGIPQPFVDQAAKELAANSNEKHSDEQLTALAKSLWHKELDNMLHLIWSYTFYEDYGITDGYSKNRKNI